MTKRYEYRVATADGKAIASHPEWYQGGPTLEQAKEYCKVANEREERYPTRLHTYEVQSRAVVETDWHSVEA